MYNPINDVEVKISGYRNEGVIIAVISKFAHRGKHMMLLLLISFASVFIVNTNTSGLLNIFVFSLGIFFVLLIVWFYCAYFTAVKTKDVISNTIDLIFPYLMLVFLPFIVYTAIRSNGENGLLLSGAIIYMALIILYIVQSRNILRQSAGKVLFGRGKGYIDPDNEITGIISDRDYEYKKCYVSFELRPAFITKPGVTLTKKIKPEGDTLSIYVGCERTSIISKPRKINFNISVIDAYGAEHFLEGRYVSSMEHWEHTKWIDIDLDVKQFIGQEVTIKLYSFSCGDKERLDNIYWSEPKITDSGKCSQAKKNILFIIDALRPDYLGCYGSKEKVSPNIDRFSKDAVLFSNAFSQGTWTLPSFISIMTGLYPSDTDSWQPRACTGLDEGIKPLAGYFRRAGYHTAAYVSHNRASANYGFARGFDTYYYKQRNYYYGANTSEDLYEKGVKFLERTKNEDVFLLIHLFDAHTNYNVSEYALNEQEFDSLKNGTLAPELFSNRKFMFKNSIKRTDRIIGSFIEYLKVRGWYDNAFITITSDHGTNFGSHRFKHHAYDGTLRVPLMMKPPASKAMKVKQIAEPVSSTSSLISTMLESANIDSEDIKDRSLLKFMKTDAGQGRDNERFVISEDIFTDYHSVSVRALDDKLIISMLNDNAESERWNGEKGRVFTEYYDIKNDPDEKNDLSEVPGKSARIQILKAKAYGFINRRKER